jgi:hypothetical protein
MYMGLSESESATGTTGNRNTKKKKIKRENEKLGNARISKKAISAANCRVEQFLPL